MCKCTPKIRTPYCGRGNCINPHDKPQGARSQLPKDVEEFIADKQRSVEWVKTYEDKYNLKQMIPISDFRAFIAQREKDHVRVPVEPTEAMIDAGVAMALQVSVSGQGGWSEYVRALYTHMLNASKGE